MQSFYCVGLDVHKKTISYCLKTAVGEKVAAGSVAATRAALTGRAEALPGPWVGAAPSTVWRRSHNRWRLALRAERAEREGKFAGPLNIKRWRLAGPPERARA